MAAPKGNRFWEARSSHGRKPIFPDAESLWAACTEYFEWVDENPLWEEKGFAFQGIVTKETFAKMRAMTISGLCTFLDITTTTWAEYRQREGFAAIVTRVEQIIRDQKFAGAAAELLNPNIIARDLGLRDSISTEHSGPAGGPIKNETTYRITFVDSADNDVVRSSGGERTPRPGKA